MPILVAIAVIAIVALGGSWLFDTRRADKEEAEAASGPPRVDPFAGGHPVPPLPGQTLRAGATPRAVGARGGGPSDDDTHTEENVRG